MRVGEVLALKTEDLFLEGDSPILHIRASMKREYKEGSFSDNDELFNDSEDNKTVLMRTSPKTYSSKRKIPLIPEAVEALRKQIKYNHGDKERAGIAYTDYGFIFANALGQPFDQRTYADYYKRIVKSAGITEIIQIVTNDVSVGFHTLRHTFATRAVENGMDILVLSKILGHAQPSTTLNKYGHVLDDHMRNSIEKIRPTQNN